MMGLARAARADAYLTLAQCVNRGEEKMKENAGWAKSMASPMPEFKS
jgi:hypothetical protein